MSKKLKVWWKPQVPMKASFEVPVNSVEEACLITDTLAAYDLFQLQNNIKPDFSNVGGLMVFEDNEWTDWYNEEDGNDFEEYCEEKKYSRITEIFRLSKIKN